MSHILKNKLSLRTLYPYFTIAEFDIKIPKPGEEYTYTIYTSSRFCVCLIHRYIPRWGPWKWVFKLANIQEMAKIFLFIASVPPKLTKFRTYKVWKKGGEFTL